MSEPTAFIFNIARQKFKVQLEKLLSVDNFEDLSSFTNFFQNYTGADLERRTAVDQILRDLSRCKIEQCQDDSDLKEETLKIVSLCINVAKSGSCSPNMPFVLLGDILDCLTLDLCDGVFTYIEEGVSVWKSPFFYNAGKNYLLRMCNDLLRRLSQSRNTVFCGRIQLFLARLFPLDEKSALNLVSQFNVENITVFNKSKNDTTLNNTATDEEEMETDESCQEKLSNVDYKLYSNIWNLQDIFRYPVQCYTKDLWDSFVENSESVLKVLSSYKIEVVAVGNISNSKHKTSYFPKFLTSEKLTDLQLSDVMFRRQILIQILILFRYLTGTIKFKGNNLVLDDDQKKWISETETQVYSLIEETPPMGKRFAAYIKHLLAREDFWVKWKNKGCQSFMKSCDPKPAAPVSSEEPPAKKIKVENEKTSIVDDFINDQALGLGSSELTKLWSICPDNFEACSSIEREYLPTLHEFFSESAEQEDTVNQIEDQYKLTRNPFFQWKALRLLSQRSEMFFTIQPVLQQFKIIPKYLSTVVNQLAKSFPKSAKQDNDELMQQASNTSTDNGGEENGRNDSTTDVLEENNGDDLEDENDEECLEDETESGDKNSSLVADEVTGDEIDIVATKVAENWKKLASMLQLKEKDIKEIEEDSDDSVMRARQALVTWQDFNDKAATKTSLIGILSSAGFSDAVKALQ